MRQSQEEAMEEGQSPLATVDPAREVTVCGEDVIEEAQEDEREAGRCHGRSRRVRGGSEALDPIQGGGGGEPLKLRPDIHQGLGWGR